MAGQVDSEVLGRVIQRLPKRKAAIRRLFAGNEEFREMCFDYVECLAVIERLGREGTSAGPRIEQYCELRVNLEQELLDSLHAPYLANPGQLQNNN